MSRTGKMVSDQMMILLLEHPMKILLNASKFSTRDRVLGTRVRSRTSLIFDFSYIDYRTESPEYAKTEAYWENLFARALFFIIFEVSLLISMYQSIHIDFSIVYWYMYGLLQNWFQTSPVIWKKISNAKNTWSRRSWSKVEQMQKSQKLKRKRKPINRLTKIPESDLSSSHCQHWH